MTQNLIYAAVAGIDEAYISDSENLPEIKAGFHREIVRRRTLTVGACACFIAAVCAIGATKMIHADLPMINSTSPTVNATVPVSPAESTDALEANALAIVPFVAKIDPDSDAYGEDELHEVRLTVNGVRYDQLKDADYERYGISGEIPDLSFGEFVGTVIESFPNQEYDEGVVSPEPSLTGAEVYRYAPANSQAVVIAKKDGNCSMFEVSRWGANRTFREACAFFGGERTDSGIASISYTVSVPGKDVYRVTTDKVITEYEKIDAICNVLMQLTPEEMPSDETAPTPQWFIDAMQAYKEHPEEYNAEDILFTVHFRNGTVMRDILYKPFIGNGYLDNMKELTSEQNAALRSLFE